MAPFREKLIRRLKKVKDGQSIGVAATKIIDLFESHMVDKANNIDAEAYVTLIDILRVLGKV